MVDSAQKNPEPFPKAHRAVLSTMVPMGAELTRVPVSAGLQSVVVTAEGNVRPSLVALEFDAEQWTSEQALEWLLTHRHDIVKFQRAD